MNNYVVTHLGVTADVLLVKADLEAKSILETVSVVIKRHKYKKGWHLK